LYRLNYCPPTGQIFFPLHKKRFFTPFSTFSPTCPCHAKSVIPPLLLSLYFLTPPPQAASFCHHKGSVAPPPPFIPGLFFFKQLSNLTGHLFFTEWMLFDQYPGALSFFELCSHFFLSHFEFFIFQTHPESFFEAKVYWPPFFFLPHHPTQQRFPPPPHLVFFLQPIILKFGGFA